MSGVAHQITNSWATPRTSISKFDPPATPSFYAFSYTVPSEKGTGRSFVGPAAAKHARAAPAMKDGSFGAATSRLRLRMAALGFGWADVAATQVYTIFNIHPLLADEIVSPWSHPRRFHLAFCAPAGAGPRHDRAALARCCRFC
jgi:hypothetical protein